MDDPIKMISQLDPDAIRRQLAEIESKRHALLILLRAAIASKRHSDRVAQNEAGKKGNLFCQFSDDLKRFIESLPYESSRDTQVSIRIRKAMSRNGIKNLDDLCGKSSGEVASWKHVGSVTLEAIRKALRKIGRSLKDDL